MSTRRHREQRRRVVGIAADRAALGRPVVLLPPPLRRDRALELADLTASECDRRHLEAVRPLLELAVAVDQELAVGRPALLEQDAAAALAAAVRIAGPCLAGWCRYPAGHTGDHEPLEAA